MASSYNFTFDSLSRIGDDVCGISERDMQNQQFGSYMTQNHWAKDCGLNKPIGFSTQQPNVFISNGGVGVTPDCQVGLDNNLRIVKTNNRTKCRISLQERPFKTVPFLGRGPSDINTEENLRHGVYNFDKKSCKRVMEKSFGSADIDLVPSLKKTIQNPSNLIEGVAVDGWIRGGLPSREVARDADYFKRNE